MQHQSVVTLEICLIRSTGVGASISVMRATVERGFVGACGR